tara:strand:- start:63 stop:245 length:183 start_codon:yes stop_codon:yes gene_type:complete
MKAEAAGRGHNAVGLLPRSACLPIVDENAQIGLNLWRKQVRQAYDMIHLVESAMDERSAS